VPWQIIADEAGAAAFAQTLAEAPFARIRGTSISSALAFAGGHFGMSGHQGVRRVIDVSGDGPNNMGPAVEPVRDALLEQGIVINGLPIMLRPSPSGVGLDRYYSACVIGGPGAFVLPVEAPDQLAEAIRRKLILEIAGEQSWIVPVAAPAATPPVDCSVGERFRRMWMEDR
jgi:hypothetical protein